MVRGRPGIIKDSVLSTISDQRRTVARCAASGKGTPFIACRLSQSSLYVARLKHDPEKLALGLDPWVDTGFRKKIMLKKLAAYAVSVRPSSSGPGHRPFTAETRVRFP
jgi:hypothetical protein